MVRIPGFALPHRARIVRTVAAGEKDEQGERERVPELGPWFPARRMTPRKSEGEAEDGGRRRVERRYALLWADRYEDGTPLTDPPKPSDELEVDVYGDVIPYVLGDPTDLDTGTAIIGGQGILLDPGDSS